MLYYRVFQEVSLTLRINNSETVIDRSMKAVPVRAERQRQEFMNEMLDMIDGSVFDVNRMQFTDETHFGNQVVSLIDTIGEFEVPKSPLILRTTTPFPQNLPCGLQFTAKSSLGLFFLRETLTTERYIALLKHFVATQQATRQGVVHARWGPPTQYTRRFRLSERILR